MVEIVPIRAEQVDDAKRVIYSVAHEIFHEAETLEESIALYDGRSHLRDVEDFQNAYQANGGVFLVMLDDGRLIGTGALRRLEDGVGEIKRLWLLPAYHGRGLGYRMMLALLDEALRQGYTRLRLETSPIYQTRALRFYRRLGFYETARFGTDEDAVALELKLE